MPVEIKELHIRVTVNQPAQGQQSAAPSASGKKEEGDEKEAMIAQCVEEVLQIIDNKKER
jgi:hypothetical protein